MKRTLTSVIAIAAMVVTMASCQKEQIPTNLEHNRIVFGVADVNITKAYSEATATSIQTNGFKVAGVTSDNAEFFNAAATYDNTNSWYATAEKYYYPEDKTMSFYSCYPSSQTIAVTSGVATLAYTHDSDIDLLVSKKTGVEASDNSVALTFDHALTLVKATVAGTDPAVTYTVKSISIKGFSAGTYTYADNTMTGGTAMTTAQTIRSTDLTAPTDGTKGDSGFTGTFIPGQVTVEATWECYNGSTLVASYTKSGNVTLTQGHQNTINISLPNAAAQGITFTVSVNAWGANEDKNITLN